MHSDGNVTFGLVVWRADIDCAVDDVTLHVALHREALADELFAALWLWKSSICPSIHN